jgi:hypothetical protein
MTTDRTDEFTDKHWWVTGGFIGSAVCRLVRASGKQANSLLAGKIQGIFVGEASQAQANAPNSSSISSRYGEVPDATEQGKFCGLTGNRIGPSGNFPHDQGNRDFVAVSATFGANLHPSLIVPTDRRGSGRPFAPDTSSCGLVLRG